MSESIVNVEETTPKSSPISARLSVQRLDQFHKLKETIQNHCKRDVYDFEVIQVLMDSAQTNCISCRTKQKLNLSSLK